MSWWFALAVFLYFISAGLIFAEKFVQSGGLISVCALGCLIGGIAIFFNQSVGMGWIGVGVAFIEMAVVIIIACLQFPTFTCNSKCLFEWPVRLACKIFPKKRFGKNATSPSLEHKAGKD
jgi:membrane-bound ClpP family serine protease